MKNISSSIKGWFLLTTLLILSSSCTETAPPSSDLEAFVDDLFASVNNKQSPGTAVMVVRDGEVILNKGYGMANLSHDIAISPTTVFDLASVSKQFCAYAISTLVEEGKIALDDDVRKHIPELPDFGNTITIDHLVHHTSGIRDWTSTLPVAGWDFHDVISFDHILRMAFNQRALNYEPGAEYSYSNTGYNLLAEIVQRVEGLSFRQWTDQNIFQPLGMEQTLFLDDHTETIPNRAQGYRQSGGTYTATPNNLLALGSSSMYSTSSDLSKWVMHLMKPGNKQPVVDRMFTRGVLNDGEEISYAFGLSVTDYQESPWISHSGSWASFRTYLCILPETGYGIVVLNNHGRNTNRMAREIADYLLGPNEEQLNLDNSSDPADVAASTMNELTGAYKLGPGWYVEITYDDDQLWTQATNEDKFPMKALSDSVFRIEAYSNRTMTFHRDEANAVTGMTYASLVRPKLDLSAAPAKSDPEDYIGTYESAELFTTYEVIAEGDQLLMKHFRHGTIELTQAWGDDYTTSRWFLGSVEFSRNQGYVDGFYVTTNRARRQWFSLMK